MKWIGIARIYDKKTGHFQCRRRVYTRDKLNKEQTCLRAPLPLYILRFSKIEGYRYKRINLTQKFKVEMVSYHPFCK